MNIGELRKVNGRLMGSIATRTIDLPKIGLRPVQSDNPRAPRFEVVALNVARRWVQIGAVWEAAMKKSGEIFLAGTIDDPSLPEPLPVALFPAADIDGYMIAWRRDTMRSDVGGGFGASNYDTEGQGGRGRAGDRGGRQDGGFGDSTASTRGELVGAGGGDGLDDDLPF